MTETTPKLDSTVTADVGEVLDLHADLLYRNLGTSIVAVVEFKAFSRVQIAADEEKAPSVTLRAIALEVANGPYADQVREVMKALFRIRTSSGTFDEIDTQPAQILEHAAAVITEIAGTAVADHDGDDGDGDDPDGDGDKAPEVATANAAAGDGGED